MPDDAFSLTNLVVDLSQTHVPDEGEYDVRIDDIKPYRAKPSEKNPTGLRMISITHTIINAEDPKANGYKVFQREATEGKGAFLVVQLIKAFEAADTSQDSVEVDATEWIGRTVRAALKLDDRGEKDGYEPRLQVNRYIEVVS